MSVARIAVLFSLAVLSATAPLPAQTAPGRGPVLPTESLLNRRGLTRRWWGHATINDQRDKLSFLTADESFLFAQSSAGAVTAFDCETGKLLWDRSVGRRDRAVYPATFNDEHLFVINGLKLFAVRKINGDIAWELNLPGQPSSSPVADSKRVYVGFLDGSQYAFDLEKIRDLYSKGLLPQYSDATVTWRYRTSHPITVPAVPVGELVSFATKSGLLYCVGAADHKLIFQFETDAPLTAPVARYKNNLLLASEDSNFYSLNSTNGKLGWEFTTGNVIRTAPVLIEDEVYLLPERGRMFKLSAETGRELWPRPQTRIESFLSASSHRLFVVDHDNNLRILSRATGESEGEFPLERFIRHVTNVRSDRIFLATERGLIMCLHERGRDFPRFHLHPERQPILPEFAPEGSDAETPAESEPADASAENAAPDKDAK
jgi:outer membrane protein assembly factor BamB